MTQKNITLSMTVCMLLSTLTCTASAATLKASISEKGKAQLGNAVVYAVPEAGLSTTEKKTSKMVIDQIDKEFVPRVSVIQTGSSIEFPNHDKIRHHVYSFSPAKSFEIPLYKGTPANPVTFEQPGVVKLGCNIHDWMSASVFITDTPYFGISDSNGNVVLNDLPTGQYNVFVWHPQQSADTQSTVQKVDLKSGGSNKVNFTVEKKKQWIPFRAPTGSAGGY